MSSIHLSQPSPLEQNQHFSSLEKVGYWIYEHPTTTKVLKISSLILGSGALLTLPLLSGAILTACLTITGAVLTLASIATIVGLDIIVPPHHDMKNHVYKPQQCEGGRLYYDGDVPILSLDADDPFTAGKAHGYLCGDAINRLSKRFDLVLHTLKRDPRAAALPKTIAALRRVIPNEYIREIEGMVAGYNRWAAEQPFWSFPKKITLEDALLFHLIPDSCHFDAETFENRETRSQTREAAVACTAIVERDPQNGPTCARNMDWPSFGLAGAYSLVVHRKHRNGLYSTVEVGVPGFVGTLTGMNEHGLSLAMNVCSGDTEVIQGMPACFYNRSCLEHCQTVNQVDRHVLQHSPLGPYHLTVADAVQAQSIHFYQSSTSLHAIRHMGADQPLATLNCRYSPRQNTPMHYSFERQNEIDRFFQQRENRPLAEALSLPFVNNWLTTHRVVMQPHTRNFKVAFDNAFAGRAPLQTVETQRLFQE